MRKLEQKKGITLVALVITVIILLILAGIVIGYILGKKGIVARAEEAGRKYKQAEVNEQKDLDEVFSSIRVAEDSKVTISMEELDAYINQKMENKLNEQPTNIKTDTWFYNESRVTTAYTATSMSGLTRANDSNNNIEKYFSYSSQDGYTVLKTGWYFIDMYTDVESASKADITNNFYINGQKVTGAYSWASGSYRDTDCNAFSIFLKEGDKIYFNMQGVNNAQQRTSSAFCYPMF